MAQALWVLNLVWQAVAGKAPESLRGGIGKPEPSEGRAQLNRQSCTFLSLYSTETSLSAESTVLSYTLWNALSQALICCLTVYPPSTAPAPPLPLRPSSPAHAILLSTSPTILWWRTSLSLLGMPSIFSLPFFPFR